MDEVLLSVVIPAYREAQRISGTLRTMSRFLSRQTYTSEIVVVDDGSDDATAEVVRSELRRDQRIQLLTHAQNRGKGAAVRTGMQAARGKYALFADADNATPFEEVDALLSVAQHGFDIVMGSRYLPGSLVLKKQSLLRRVMSRGGNLLFRWLLGLSYADTRCGFKIFSRRSRQVVFPRQTLQRWGFDTELLVIAQLHGLRVKEVPVRWFDRERGNIHPLRDSLRSLQEIFHIRLQRRQGIYQ